MEIDRRRFATRAGAVVATAWVAPEVLTLQTPAAAASATTTTTSPPLVPVLLGTMPQAAAQPTDWGKRIQELIVFDGVVFAGYGDWDANTGPIAAAGWDIGAASWVSEASLDNECTWLYRRVGNRLVVPFIDPKYNTADLAVRSLGSSTWTPLAIGAGTAGTIHAFDVATLDGTDLWVAGAKRGNDDAAIWRSASGLGGDWVQVHTYTPAVGYFARYVQLVAAYGKLYTSGYYADGVNPSVSLAGEVWDGSSWGAAPEFTLVGGTQRRGHRPMVFGSQVVRSKGWPLSLNPSPPPTYLLPALPLLWFDGTTLTEGPEQSFHHNLDASGNLWWIDETRAVRRRAPGGPTQFVVQAPADASAVAVDGTDLYIGTTGSQLYVVSGV